MVRQLFKLDPRTKFFLIIMSALFVLSRIGGRELYLFQQILTVIPYVLLLAEGEYPTCIRSAAALLFGHFLLSVPSFCGNAAAGAAAIAVGGILVRLVPAIATGAYAIKTTKVSEFTAAMEKMHVSEKIIIPATVIFRFLPTVQEEFRSIGDAMKLRGITLCGSKASEMLEYRLVPMLISSVRIGEDLSAAAITRGLASGTKRTNICRVGFHFLDYAFFLFFAAVIVRFIMKLIGV